MTIQTILNQMMLLNNELQLETSGSDVTTGLTAVNASLSYFESLVSQYPRILGDQTADITTTANTETTSFPTGFLRIDRIQMIDTTQSPNLPIYDVIDIKKVGGHRWSAYWPWN